MLYNFKRVSKVRQNCGLWSVLTLSSRTEIPAIVLIDVLHITLTRYSLFPSALAFSCWATASVLRIATLLSYYKYLVDIY